MAPATPFLLTPGPLTTSDETKRAMLRDWGSRDTDFIALNWHVREELVALAGGVGTHVAVPLQGSGTFAVEVALRALQVGSGDEVILDGLQRLAPGVPVAPQQAQAAAN